MKVVHTLFILLCSFPIFLFAQTDSLLLLQSIKNNDTTKVASLLQTEIDINTVDEDGANALMWAVYKADLSVVKHLRSKGAVIPQKGTIHLHSGGGYYGNLTGIAAGEGKLDILKYLIDTLQIPIDEKEYNEETDTTDGWTALQWGAAKNKPAIVNYLIAEKADTIIAIPQLCKMYRRNDEHDKAISLLNSAIRQVKQKEVLDSTLYITYLASLASTYAETGEYAEAIRLAKKALEDTKNSVGKAHANYRSRLNSLAMFYKYAEEYEKALPLFIEALEHAEKYSSKKDLSYGIQLNNLAMFYNDIGAYEKAIPLSRAVLENIANSVGEGHRYYGMGLNNLAMLYEKTGVYEKALSLSIKALEHAEKYLGKEDSDYGLQLSNLAHIYHRLGAYDEALPRSIKALEHAKKYLRKGHSYYRSRLNNLAMLYEDKEDYEAAEDLAIAALKHVEKYLDKEHSEYGMQLHNLAHIYQSKKDYGKALPLAEAALKNTKNNLGEEHPDYTFRLNNLAVLHYAMGKPEKALPLYIAALENTEKNLGKEHFYYGRFLNNLLEVYLKTDSYKVDSICLELAENLNFMLKERIPYLPEKIQFSSIKPLNDQKNKINSCYIDQELPLSIYQLNTQFKGLTIRNLTNFAEEEDNEEYLTFVGLKKLIGRELSKPKSNRSRNFQKWQKEADALEARIMSERLVNHNLINVDAMKNTLAPDEIIIDIHHFNYHHPIKTDSIYYVASIIDPSQKAIKQVYLFEEKELATLVNQNQVQQVGDNLQVSVRGGYRIVPTENSANLYSLIWAPLLPYLKNKKRIHFSPSGLLNKINQKAIAVNRDSITDIFEIINHININTVLNATKTYEGQDYLLVGGINYDSMMVHLDSLDELPISDDLIKSLDTIKQQIAFGVPKINRLRATTMDKWLPLPNTKTEIEGIDSSFKKTVNWKGQRLEGIVATEKIIKSRLSQKESPRVIHFATHGFFIEDVKKQQGKQKNVFTTADDPMIRAGLILAGANPAWQGKIVQEGEEDGILTAYEIQNLNLRNTELVVLSACETGLGEIRGSEGVFGLQRAFKIAGVKHLIMSLRQVPDKQTADFMIAFYKYWLSHKKSIKEAFSLTQQDMSKNSDDPLLWTYFILIE